MAKDTIDFDKIIEKSDLDPEGLTLFTWYEVLGLPLYGSFDQKKFEAINKEVTTEYSGEKLNKARTCLNKARANLSNPDKEKAYKEKLERGFKEKLEKFIDDLKNNDTLTDANKKKVLQRGQEYKLENEIVDSIIESKRLVIVPDKIAGTFTSEGTPILEIINSTTNKKEKGIVLKDVKLFSKVTQTVIIKNGGGGYLNATISSSSPWIQLSSDKIEQKDLPKSINIIINPSRDKTLKNSTIHEGKLVFSYTIPNGKVQTQYLSIEITTEGYENVIRRKSLWSVGIYFAIFLGANTYLPFPTFWATMLWWIAAFFLWKTANWFFSRWPLNKEMVVLLPSIFLACMYYGIKTANRPKDADLSIIPLEKIGYIKPAEGAYIRDFPISGTPLGLIICGDSLRVVGRDSISNWYKVAYYDGEIKYGYMSNELLTFDIGEVRSRKKKVTDSKVIKATNRLRKRQADSTNNVDEGGLLKSDSI